MTAITLLNSVTAEGPGAVQQVSPVLNGVIVTITVSGGLAGNVTIEAASGLGVSQGNAAWDDPPARTVSVLELTQSQTVLELNAAGSATFLAQNVIGLRAWLDTPQSNPVTVQANW